ncbi:MAG: DUF2330 domain-containing protein [Candidatus Limnocylindria bacterium]
MRRTTLTLIALVATMLAAAAPALGCAGLIGPNGAVNLLRTTTFAGYHDGVEHYVTSFEFAGGGGRFGSLVPLPGVPSSVERGGKWTLQRLALETAPRRQLTLGSAPTPARGDAEVLLTTRVDALDITVLRGGGEAVGRWATENGFRLPPDAPEVLDFYAARSPIFLAAVFDADAAKARGQGLGDGTPVHISIPTSDPWVPLRILGLGKTTTDRIEADVYLLTDVRPSLLPGVGGNGLELTHSAAATSSLLADLRSDDGMSWVPADAWLTKVRVDAAAGQLRYDLAVGASGTAPSPVAAGLLAPPALQDPSGAAPALAAVALAAVALAAVALALLTIRRGRHRARFS